MARVYHQSRIGINHAVRDDLNMRFFELASAGVSQLADDRMVGLRDLGFLPWVHYIPYDSGLSAVENARAMLQRDEERQECVVAARKLVRSSHTYAHRVRTMLADAGQ
jgi:spore maturation protein CgeB